MTNNKKNSTKKEIPMVSVCTPTFNRRPFIENMFNCFRNQTYPKHRIEWIIVDDGTDKIKDLIETSNIPQIRYFEVDEKMTLGAKRNYMHSFVRGQIVVYMDDDDYYPPERIEDAVEKLEANPKALCAGSSEIYIYFKHIEKMYQCGPYGPNHATAGTFAFRKELLQHTKYEDHAALAEERAFLKEYTIPFVQLDPMKAILVFSHEHNTFDKRKMLDNQHPNFFKESPKTVDMFIRKAFEKPVKDFFLNNIDKLLENYEPGLPKMKPDVIKQIKEIEQEREKMMKEEMKKMQNSSPIMLQRPGQEPIQLSNQDVVNMIQEQQNQLTQLSQKCGEYENMITILQKQLVDKTKTIRDITSSQTTVGKQTNNVNFTISENNNNDAKNNVELENMISMLQKQLIEKTKTIRELSSKKPTQLQEQPQAQAQATNNSDELIKENNELQKMVGMLQQKLIEKTVALRDANEKKISIQTNNSKSIHMSKSDPEVIVDINTR
jgi:glycosyltransferase involved in cell wall biosynthesis